jgi:hypothetical protein
MAHTPKWIGYRWLGEAYGVDPVQPFRVDSRIAGTRATERTDGYVHESYPSALQPADTLQGHLTFALKREGVHLEFLARLFDAVPVGELKQWIASEPSGQYARRAGFLYEWLTGRRLAFPGVSVGNYVDALDEDLYLTASSPANNPRWRVRNNLPGTSDYCPLVFRTDKVSVKQPGIGRKKASLTRTSSRCLQRTKPPATLYFYLGQAPPLTPLTEIGESLTKVSL